MLLSGLKISVLILFCVISTFSFSQENSSQLYKRAAGLAQSGDIDSAIPLFKKVIQLSPYFSMGHYGLGKAYLHKEGMLDDAIKELRAAADLEKSFSKAHFYLGIALMFRKNYYHSMRAFARAYELDTTCLESLYNIGAIYDIIGHPFKSRHYFSIWINKKSGGEDIFFDF